MFCNTKHSPVGMKWSEQWTTQDYQYLQVILDRGVQKCTFRQYAELSGKANIFQIFLLLIFFVFSYFSNNQCVPNGKNNNIIIYSPLKRSLYAQYAVCMYTVEKKKKPWKCTSHFLPEDYLLYIYTYINPKTTQCIENVKIQVKPLLKK